MPKGSNTDHAGEQSCGSVSRLQCAVHVRNGTRLHAISAGVYVPRDTAAAQLYELRRTIAFGAYSLSHWNTSHFSNLQEEL